MAVIPGRNPIALVAYYLGIFSLIPFIGFVTALPAIICGIIGMVHANANPEIAGKGHALAGIILGLLGPFIGLGIMALLGLLFWFFV